MTLDQAVPSPPAFNADFIPPWYTLALAELGVREIAGARHNPRILEYRRRGRIAGKLPDTDEVNWCSIFANFCVEVSGHHGTRSAMARSFERSPHMLRLARPRFGCIVTFWRVTEKSGSGHVGFWCGEDDRVIYLLSGNSRDCVDISATLKLGAKIGFTGYWWPQTYHGHDAPPAPPPVSKPEPEQVLSDWFSDLEDWSQTS